MRLVMVVGPVGGVSLARLESASPDGERAMDEDRGWVRMEGSVS